MRVTRLVPLVALCLGSIVYADTTAPPRAESTFTERVSTGLLQLRMEVTGPADELFRLDSDDFEIWVGDRQVTEFEIDRILEKPTTSVDGYKSLTSGRRNLVDLSPVTDPVHARTLSWCTDKVAGSITLPASTWSQPAHGASISWPDASPLGERTRSRTSLDPVRMIPAILSVELPAGTLEASTALRVVSRKEHRAIRFRTTESMNEASPSADRAGQISTSLVPTVFEDGKFRGLLQVLLNASRAGGSWELQASVLSNHGSTAIWGHIAPPVSQRKFALQDVIEVRPGPFEIVAFARHAQTGETLTAHVSGELSKPGAGAAVTGSITLMQPATGAILRTGRQASSTGSIVVTPGEPVAGSKPLALLTTICRDAGRKKPVMVRRSILGVVAVEFPPTLIEPGGDRCVLIEDLVPAGTLGGGTFEYRVGVREQGQAERTTARRFEVGATDVHLAYSSR